MKLPRTVKSALRFGRSPKPRISVNPESGAHSVTFFFNGTDFDVGSRLQIKIIDPSGRCLLQRSIIADRNGGFGSSAFCVGPGQLAAGVYTFSVAGTYGHGRVVVREQKFHVR